VATNSRNIVAHVLGSRGKMAPTLAEEVLTWQFSAAEKKRVARLLDKNNRGTISQSEMGELDTLVTLGDILDVLHAKARLALRLRQRDRAA
jgi:hypothetical protein